MTDKKTERVVMRGTINLGKEGGIKKPGDTVQLTEEMADRLSPVLGTKADWNALKPEEKARLQLGTTPAPKYPKPAGTPVEQQIQQQNAQGTLVTAATLPNVLPGAPQPSAGLQEEMAGLPQDLADLGTDDKSGKKKHK